MRKLLFTSVGLLALAWALPASAIQITALGQTSGNNTVTGTQNAAVNPTATNINASTQVNISQLFGQVTPILANFGLTAHSTDAAATAFGLVVQHYAGSFCLTSLAGCGGTNFLSGTFSDAAIGALGGPGLVVNVSNPPDALSLTSSVIAATMLAAPSSFNLSFSNVTPALAICNTTLCSFTASFSGTVSASAAPVETPEPGTLGLLSAGLFGLAFLRRRKEAGLA